MKRKLVLSLFLAAAGFCLYAGDVAVFDDIGFSADGKYYVFGQYGKTDKKFVPYSEIYTVDVEKNDYVAGKVFKLSAKSNKSGKEIHQENTAKVYTKIKDMNCKPADMDHVLYILDEVTKSSLETIEFNSFEEKTSDNGTVKYIVNLKPSYGADNKSSFYISVKCVKNNGQEVEYKVGNPQIRRKNVTNYRIVKIFTDPKRKYMVFVIEKTIEDDSGTSIRYMVETKSYSQFK